MFILEIKLVTGVVVFFCILLVEVASIFTLPHIAIRVLHRYECCQTIIFCCNNKAVALSECLALSSIYSGVFDNVLNVMIFTFLRIILRGVCLEILFLLKPQRYIHMDSKLKNVK